MSWWKRRKCATCKKVLKPKKQPVHELRVGTADGIIELEVCDACSIFFDKTAEVINKPKNNKPLDLGEFPVMDEDDE